MVFATFLLHSTLLIIYTVAIHLHPFSYEIAHRRPLLLDMLLKYNFINDGSACYAIREIYRMLFNKTDVRTVPI